MRVIYLDNSATTPIPEEIKNDILKFSDCYFNPSSVHAGGIEARRLTETARNELFSAFDVPSIRRVDNALPFGSGAPDGWRFIFTSSGTEADNLAISGVLGAKQFKNTPKIITTDSEHPAVLSLLRRLQIQNKIKLSLLSTKGGAIDLSELKNELTEDAVLVSIMTVNNETGSRYDIESAFSLAKKILPNVITHTDAVQGFLKTPVSWKSAGCDLVTVSGHKIGAPKGIGGLLISNIILRSKRLSPIIFGGGQEGGLRSGTENFLGITAFGKAAALGKREFNEFYSKMSSLRELFKSNLSPDVKVNQPEVYAPHIISITLPRIKSETMLRFLSEKGIYISAGSACSSRNEHVSSALTSFGLTDKEASSTVRVSLGRQNTEEEVIAAAQAINEGLNVLARKQ